MNLSEMSAEELVSNHERLCEMYFLRDDDIDEELRNSFSEIIFRITRMENLKCCGNCILYAKSECPNCKVYNNFKTAEKSCHNWQSDNLTRKEREK